MAGLNPMDRRTRTGGAETRAAVRLRRATTGSVANETATDAAAAASVPVNRSDSSRQERVGSKRIETVAHGERDDFYSDLIEGLTGVGDFPPRAAAGRHHADTGPTTPARRRAGPPGRPGTGPGRGR